MCKGGGQGGAMGGRGTIIMRTGATATLLRARDRRKHATITAAIKCSGFEPARDRTFAASRRSICSFCSARPRVRPPSMSRTLGSPKWDK
jgi:hypothetical protein